MREGCVVMGPTILAEGWLHSNLQPCPLFRERDRTPHNKKIAYILREFSSRRKKNRWRDQDDGLIPGQAGRLTVSAMWARVSPVLLSCSMAKTYAVHHKTFSSRAEFNKSSTEHTSFSKILEILKIYIIIHNEKYSNEIYMLELFLETANRMISFHYKFSGWHINLRAYRIDITAKRNVLSMPLTWRQMASYKHKFPKWHI
jgi:hypothetical protein